MGWVWVPKPDRQKCQAKVNNELENNQKIRKTLKICGAGASEQIWTESCSVV